MGVGVGEGRRTRRSLLEGRTSWKGVEEVEERGMGLKLGLRMDQSRGCWLWIGCVARSRRGRRGLIGLDRKSSRRCSVSSALRLPFFIRLAFDVACDMGEGYLWVVRHGDRWRKRLRVSL